MQWVRINTLGTPEVAQTAMKGYVWGLQLGVSNEAFPCTWILGCLLFTLNSNLFDMQGGKVIGVRDRGLCTEMFIGRVNG